MHSSNEKIAELRGKRDLDLFTLARYLYRIGDPLLSDAEYEALKSDLEQKGTSEITEFLNRTYDDDPVPLALLNEFGLEAADTSFDASKEELYDYLNEDKSFSIKSVTSYEAAFEFFKILVAAKLDCVASLKMDGVNTKMLYTNGDFAISLSRGRKGDSFDYTNNSAKVMPKHADNCPKLMKVVGESYVRPDDLPSLRKTYGKPDGYVTGKSAAISMLRVAHSTEDYAKLHTNVFYAEGLSDTLIGTFEELEKRGFETVPYMLVKWETIPLDFNEFKDWLLNKILTPIHTVGQRKGMPSDGVVIEVNNLNWVGTQHNQYVSRQVALKFEYWGYAFYEGIVRNIVVEQKRVFKSVRVVIEPITTRDGSHAEVINSFNPSIVFDNDLEVGKKVYFERNSEAVNVMIHGERLQKILSAKEGEENVEE